jgi:hypothetical protein
MQCGSKGPPPEPGATGSSATLQPKLQPPGPSEVQQCQFVSDNGEPLGPVFDGDPFGPNGIPQAVLDAIKPQLIEGQKRLVAETVRRLSATAVFDQRERSLGTLYGVGWAVLLGATFFGAEMRWGVWRTLLTHEPRRGRLLLSKLGALWTFIAMFAAIGLAVSAATDVIMRAVADVHASAGPSTWHLVKQALWMVLPIEMYATWAAALALAIRTSIAGVGALVLMVGDHLLTSKFTWFRVLLPTQQIAWLSSGTDEGARTGYAWFTRIGVEFRCEPSTGTGFPICKETVLKTIPHWRGSLVLVAWTIAFALAAWAALRVRDVAQ